ncbi:MAG: aquaporin Z [Flavobacteriaceae bacterium]|jgi:aquaporin Z
MVIFGTTAAKASPLNGRISYWYFTGFNSFCSHLITGTSVNPARSLGPALFAGGMAMCQFWLFIVAPIADGLFAALVRKVFIDD